jgi:hypothetical protein
MVADLSSAVRMVRLIAGFPGSLATAGTAFTLSGKVPRARADPAAWAAGQKSAIDRIETRERVRKFIVFGGDQSGT